MYWKFILTYVTAGVLITYHGAWRSIECPLLLAFATLVCIIIKTKSNEQGKKKGTK